MRTIIFDDPTIAPAEIPPNHIIDKCQLFADSLYAKRFNYYRTNRCANENRFKAQIRDGKIAEFFVAQYMRREFNRPLILPDLEIRSDIEQARHFYDVDLEYGDIHLHVKSCVPQIDIPESYMFNLRDPLIKSENQNDWVAFVLMSKLGHCQLRGLAPFIGVRHLLVEPISEALKNKKRVIYASELNLSKSAM